MTLPPCATWQIWYGKEIEGSTDIGATTLFMRKLDCTVDDWNRLESDMAPRLTRQGTVSRIWFCKEFTNWRLMVAIGKHFEKVCVEVAHKSYDHLPRGIKMNYQIYIKLPLMLKPGDHVCVGAPFNDEAFEIGKGVRVKPEQYLSDEKVK